MLASSVSIHSLPHAKLIMSRRHDVLPLSSPRLLRHLFICRHVYLIQAFLIKVRLLLFRRRNDVLLVLRLMVLVLVLELV